MVMYKIKQFFRNIKNLIRWFPIIWKDRDWDDHFIFEILKFKLKNQAKYIGYHDRHVSAKRDAEIMILCVRLIEKIQDEYYACEYQDYHESELIFVDSEDHPGMYEMIVVEKSERYNDYFKKYPLIYRMVPDLNAPKDKIAFQIARINEERAHKLLFKILEQNITRWWD
jgi:hypothetical protein